MHPARCLGRLGWNCLTPLNPTAFPDTIPLGFYATMKVLESVGTQSGKPRHGAAGRRREEARHPQCDPGDQVNECSWHRGTAEVH